MVLCTAAFVPSMQRLAHRILGINSAERVLGSLRLAVYGTMGILLILVGASVAIGEAAQERAVSEANDVVDALVVGARNDLQADDISGAREKIQVALAVPHANVLAVARQLGRQIGISTDPILTRAAMMDVPIEAFQEYTASGTLPEQMVSGYYGEHLTVDVCHAAA
jgi:hypothetical protein